jgi:FO synthase subunit 2
MAGSPPPSGGFSQQPPLSVCPADWDLAGRLLVSPPEPSAAEPYRPLPLDELLVRLDAAHHGLAPAATGVDGGFSGAERLPGVPDPGLALALLERPWSEPERERLRAAADRLRQRLAGDAVTYVINRNLNSSNICVLRCGFCAFRRDEGQSGAYRLPLDLLSARAAEAHRLGATELCLQASLDPQARLQGSHLAWAEQLLRQLAAAAPGVHLHAFSPQELLFIAQADGLPLDTVLRRLRGAGLGSVPGTAAEVLSERIRRVICPEKLSARAWVTVMLQLQRHGLAATSTLMAGHIEQAADRVAHLLTLVALQRHAWQHHSLGFSEFVLLPFIGASAPAPLRQRVGRDQPDIEAMLLLTAQARLLLGPWFIHHQPSWVKLTLPHAVEALRWGCDDIGGTLMEEHITTMAGASGGTCQTPEALQRAVGAIGRPVRQRTTLYGSPSAEGAMPADAAPQPTRGLLA